ncbi:MAG: tetratricopeptide repeat protein [Algicola sp.]|nr:tetratricopeptide repeat protein [Algicola sp.]
MSASLTDQFTIDELSIDLAQWQVYRQSEKVDMTKQSLDLLLVLAKAWPNTISQQELMTKVWQGRVVSEQSVKQAIKRLRESLGDLGESYVKVVRGRGYRLDCEKVEAIQKEQTAQIEQIEDSLQKAPDKRTPWLVGVAALLASVSIYFIATNLLPEEQPALQLKAKTELSNIQSYTTSEQAYQTYTSGLEYYQRYRVEDAKIAISQFKKAIELDKNFVKAYAALSDAQSLAGNLEEAIITAQYAISLDSNDSAAYKALGHAYSRKGWFIKAIETYRQALKINPENFAALSNTGFHFRELGRLDEALFWHLKALELDSENAIVCLHVAQTLSYLGLQSHALRWFEKVKSIRPDYYHLYYSLTYFYLAAGELSEAINIVTQGQKLLPDNTDIIVAAGDVALATGDHAKALELFLQVSESDEDMKLTHYAVLRVGQLYWLQGEKEQANDILNQALVRTQSMLAQGDEWPGNYVDIASIYAIKQSHVESIAWLNRAFDVGWVDYKRLSYDPAFTDMQALPEFIALISKVESKVLTMRHKAKQLVM